MKILLVYSNWHHLKNNFSILISELEGVRVNTSQYILEWKDLHIQATIEKSELRGFGKLDAVILYGVDYYRGAILAERHPIYKPSQFDELIDRKKKGEEPVKVEQVNKVEKAAEPKQIALPVMSKITSKTSK